MEFTRDTLEQYLNSHPDSPVFARLADLYLQRDELEKAQRLCEEGTERLPEFTTGWIIAGEVAFSRGELTEAKSYWEYALETDPSAVRAADLLLRHADALELTPGERQKAGERLVTLFPEHEAGKAALKIDRTDTGEPKAGDEESEPSSQAEPPEIREEDMEASGSAETSEEEQSSEIRTGAESVAERFKKAFEGRLKPGDVESEPSADVPDEQEVEGTDMEKQSSEEETGTARENIEPEATQISEEPPESGEEDTEDAEKDTEHPEDEDVYLKSLRKRQTSGEEEFASGMQVGKDPTKQIPFTHPFYDPGEDDLDELGSDETESGAEHTDDATHERISDSAGMEEPSETPDDTEQKTRETSGVLGDPEEPSLKITERMATFTFANVLRSQGLYEQAYQVLEIMRGKTDDTERIDREQAELKKLIEQQISR